MLRRFRLGLAIVSVAVLLAQAVFAGASAVACMKVCEEAKAASDSKGASCHGDKSAPRKGASKKGCNGGCSYICSADKATAVPVKATTVQLPTFEVLAVLPSVTEHENIVPVASPELFQTDSSPPLRSPLTSHLLRAPPIFGA